MKQGIGKVQVSTIVVIMLMLVGGIIGMSGGLIQPGTALADNFGSLTDNGTAAYMGIGIAVPQRPLHLVGNACLFERTDNDSAGFIIKRTAANRWVFGVDELPQSQFVIKTYPEGQPATARMVIDTSGRVGIGTTSPYKGYKLSVANDNATDGASAIVGLTLGGNTAGVGGANNGAHTVGYLGGQSGGSGIGAYGENTNMGSWGVLGGYETGGTYGIGAYGSNTNYSTQGCLGARWAGVHGNSGALGTYAGYFNGPVYINGSYTATGTKSFVMPDPVDPAKEIYYVTMEGPEAGTFLRGSAVLKNGEAVIDLPDHFAKTTADGGLTIQLTPSGKWLQLYTAERSTARLVIREASGQDGEFDYLVNGVRKGYEDFQVIRDRIPQPAMQSSIQSPGGMGFPGGAGFMGGIGDFLQKDK